MKLSALADFHRVAEAGSLGRASRENDRPKATLSRQIRQLEESLSVRLLERQPRGLHLTREGQALYEETYALLRDIEETGRRLASGQEQLRGVLRVSAPVLFSETAGARLAIEFVERFPGIQLEWDANDRQLDLVREGIDVVIRINPSPDSALVGRCFAHDKMVLVAPPSLQVPAGANADAPGPVPAIAMSGAPAADTWPVHIDGHKNRQMEVIPNYRLRLASFSMVRAAVRAGAGAAWLPRSLIQSDIAAGKVVIWGVDSKRTIEAWVLHNSRRLVNRKISAFVAFIVEMFPDRVL